MNGKPKPPSPDYAPQWYGPAKWHGMNWIRKVKRLAIYLRDGLACVYCRRGVEQGARLTLDHVLTRAEALGTGLSINDAGNLLTACHDCNSTRGDQDIDQFVSDAAELRVILRQLTLPLPLAEARALISRRVSVRAAVRAAARAAAGSCRTGDRCESRKTPSPS